jgi:dTDP-4-amino-4,6-dideoxygalactose transaminase
MPECVSIYNQYVIRTPERDKLAEELRRQDIGCEIYYPLCLPLQPCFAHLGYKAGTLAEAERATAEVLALPIYPELGAEEQQSVIRATLAGRGQLQLREEG